MYFSVVIPLYNKEQSIHKTIQSVLSQTYTAFELLVIDDGSTDDSLSVVKKMNDSRLRIINQQNSGVSVARNRGIQEAKHDYVSFLDADDWWDKNYLNETRKLIIDFPQSVMYGSSFAIHISNSSSPVKANLPGGFRGEITNYSRFVFDSLHAMYKDRSLQNVNLFHSSSATFNKAAIESSGGYNSEIKLMEDWDVYFRIAASGSVAYYNKVLAYFNHDAENRCSFKITRSFSEYACFNDKIRNYYKNDKYAAYFWNYFALATIRKFYFSERKKEAKQLLNKLNFKNQPIKWFILYRFPYRIALIIENYLQNQVKAKK